MNIHHRTFRRRIPFIKPPRDLDCCSQISLIRFKWADMLLLSSSDLRVCSCENHRRLLMTRRPSWRGVPYLEGRAHRLTPVTQFQGAGCKLTATAKNTKWDQAFNAIVLLMFSSLWIWHTLLEGERNGCRAAVRFLYVPQFHVGLQHGTQSDFDSRLWRELGVEK